MSEVVEQYVLGVAQQMLGAGGGPGLSSRIRAALRGSPGNAAAAADSQACLASFCDAEHALFLLFDRASGPDAADRMLHVRAGTGAFPDISPQTICGVLFVKLNPGALDEAVPPEAQMQSMMIGNSPFETEAGAASDEERDEEPEPAAAASFSPPGLLLAYVRHAIQPLLKAYDDALQELGRAPGLPDASPTAGEGAAAAAADAAGGAAASTRLVAGKLAALTDLRRRMAEVELSLGRLQQQSAIPVLRLLPESEVADAVEQLRSECAGEAEDAGVDVDDLLASPERDLPGLSELGLAHLAKQDQSLERLHGCLNRWRGEIRRLTGIPDERLTTLQREIESLASQSRPDATSKLALRARASGGQAAAAQLSFWAALEQALGELEVTLRKPEVKLTLGILEEGKRHVVARSFLTNLGVDGAKQVVARVQRLSRAVDPGSITSTTSMAQLGTVVQKLGADLRRAASSDAGGGSSSAATAHVDRLWALTLLQSVTVDLVWQLTTLLGGGRVIRMPVEEVAEAERDVERLLDDWYATAADLFPKGSALGLRGASLAKQAHVLEFLPTALQGRLKQVKETREAHELLKSAVESAFKSTAGGAAGAAAAAGAAGGPTPPQSPRREGASREAGDGGDADKRAALVAQLDAAMDSLGQLDVLDLSAAGEEAWARARQRHEKRAEAVEMTLKTRVTKQLEAAGSSDERLLETFTGFGELMRRSRVMAATEGSVKRLVQFLRAKLDGIRSRVGLGYKGSGVRRFRGSRGLPPVSGAIVWARQLLGCLSVLKAEAAAVLGPDWAQTTDGVVLAQGIRPLERQLQTNRAGRTWSEELKARDDLILMQKPILLVWEVPRARRLAGTASHVLQVNFPADVDLMLREAAQLQQLGVKPTTHARKLVLSTQPFKLAAMSLRASLQRAAVAEGRAAAAVTASAGASPLGLQPECTGLALVAEALASWRRLVGAAVGPRQLWDAATAEQLAADLAGAVAALEGAARSAEEQVAAVTEALAGLRRCSLSPSGLHGAMGRLRELVVNAAHSGLGNAHRWCDWIDAAAADILARRLRHALALSSLAWERAADAARAAAEEQQGDAEAPGGGGGGGGVEHPLGVSRAVEDEEWAAWVQAVVAEAEAGEFPPLPADWPRAITGRDDRPTTSQHAIATAAGSLAIEPPLAEAGDWLSSVLGSLCTLVCGQARLWVDGAVGAVGHQATPIGSDLLQIDPPAPVSGEQEALGTCADALGTALASAGALSGALRRWSVGWLRLAGLWTHNPADLHDRIGTDAGKWSAVLRDIRSLRRRLDRSQDRSAFGPVVVVVGEARSALARRCEEWRAGVLERLAQVAAHDANELKAEVASARSQLDQAQPVTSDAGRAVAFVSAVFSVRSGVAGWHRRLGGVVQADRVLRRNRAERPKGWVSPDALLQELRTLCQGLNHRAGELATRVPALTSAVEERDRALWQRMQMVRSTWEALGGGAARPEDALKAIAQAKASLAALGEEGTRVSQARELLNQPMLQTDGAAAFVESVKKLTDRVTGDGAAAAGRSLDEELAEADEAAEEAAQMQAVAGADTGGLAEDVAQELGMLEELEATWRAVSGVWLRLQKTSVMPWAEFDRSEVQSALETMLRELRAMAPEAHQTEPHKDLVASVSSALKAMPLLGDLQGAGLEPRHWEQLERVASLPPPPEVPVHGHSGAGARPLRELWTDKVRSSRAEIDRVLQTSRGESALRGFLEEVERHWEGAEVELVLHPASGAQLIGGWGDLIEELEEHLDRLDAMKASPNFAPFKQKTSQWSGILQDARQTLQNWLDVQRKWVHLQGVFARKGGAAAELRAEGQRFAAIDRHFRHLARNAVAKRRVLGIVSMPDLNKDLRKLSDSSDRIQRALGEFLEGRRVRFPRFFFVGDDDLLDVIGGSGDPSAAQRHVPKLFQGASSFLVSTSGTGPDAAAAVSGLVSPEGERLLFATPVDAGGERAADAWMLAVEGAMKDAVLAGCRDALSDAPRAAWVPDSAAPEGTGASSASRLVEWMRQHTCQSCLLASSALYTLAVETALAGGASGKKKTKKSQRADTGALDGLRLVEASTSARLAALASAVGGGSRVSALERRAAVALITETVHQRDVTRELVTAAGGAAPGVQESKETDAATADLPFEWSVRMRAYLDQQRGDGASEPLQIHMGEARCDHGLEYGGVGDRLVVTPLTERCFLTLMQALQLRLGGSPFGPAGTGKTESVKALGSALGRLVLVFNCDGSFDLAAMGRILAGLAAVGAWGCFDEFNRLEEATLSAVSAYIASVQQALAAQSPRVEVGGRTVGLDDGVGIFITMNPGYAGRRELPDNLKALFRPCAMMRPDRRLIAQVLLFSEGFQHAEGLAARAVLLFQLAKDQLSKQGHYDWGLRSLKSVLVAAGRLRRRKAVALDGDAEDAVQVPASQERDILLQAIGNSMLPELVAADVALFRDLVAGVFPGSKLLSDPDADLRSALLRAAATEGLLSASAVEAELGGLAGTQAALGRQPGTLAGRRGRKKGASVRPSRFASPARTRRPVAIDLSSPVLAGLGGARATPLSPSRSGSASAVDGDPADAWGLSLIEKALQLWGVTQLRHGVMLVGPAGAGKSTALRLLGAALRELEAARGGSLTMHVIDAKTLSKPDLFGQLSPVTGEWSDGVVPALLREIAADPRLSSKKPPAASSSAAAGGEAESKAAEEGEEGDAASDDGQESKEGELASAPAAAPASGLAPSQRAGAGVHRHWIVFDGDVDPEWAESLNSLLDDNRILTLASGERLALSSAVRILFEVDSLRCATPATVSRCGMVWLADPGAPATLATLRSFVSADVLGGDPGLAAAVAATAEGEDLAETRQMVATGPGAGLTLARREVAATLAPLVGQGGLLASVVEWSFRRAADHLETPSRSALAGSVLNLLRAGLRATVRAAEESLDTSNDTAGVARDAASRMRRWALWAAVWGCGSALPQTGRLALAAYIARAAEPSDLPPGVAEAARSIAQQAGGGATGGGRRLDFGDDEEEDEVEDGGDGDGADAAPSDAVDNGDSLLSWAPDVSVVEVGGGHHRHSGAGQWVRWMPEEEELPRLDPVRVAAGREVVDTADTRRHEAVVSAWLEGDGPAVLCGPPGSGKTMTLTSVLEGMSSVTLATINFSAGTTPAGVLEVLEQHCIYKDAAGAAELRPADEGTTVVVFCDEINLPTPDPFGTQTALSLIRGIVEHGGFWRPGAAPAASKTSAKLADQAWVRVRGVRFVAACNPKTDPGRHPLPPRLLRHAPVLYVDFPSRPSLRRIFGSFSAALLRRYPRLAPLASTTAEAMVDFYDENRHRFTPAMQPHYVYSPRELARWCRALHEGLASRTGLQLGRSGQEAAAVAPGASARDVEDPSAMEMDDLLRLWAHEGLRLFQDRLVGVEERQWCSDALDRVARRHFPQAPSAALQRPILFSTWLDGSYSSCGVVRLRQHLEARLSAFREEEMPGDDPLVATDAFLEHALRVSRVLDQPGGHVLLVGTAGAGKTVLSRFVAWMGGLSLFRIAASRRYTLAEFEEDLRTLLRRVGVAGERVAFLFDESNAVSSAFLERMNGLLASGEVPGLFQGDDRKQLLGQILQAADKEGVSFGSAADADGEGAAAEDAGAAAGAGSSAGGSGAGSAGSGSTEDDAWSWFTSRVQRRLHVIFTMNPPGKDGLSQRAATSPALFNRCVVDWVGDWPRATLAQVGQALLEGDDLQVSGAFDMPELQTLPDEALQAAGLAKAFEGTAAASGASPATDVTPESLGSFSIRSAIVAALMEAHARASEAAERQSLRAGTPVNMSPRDFLSCVRQFRKLLDEKRGALENQQLHLTSGLEQLSDTASAVATMQSELDVKKDELKAKDAAAAQKLEEMLVDKKLAEEQQVQSRRLREQLEQRDGEVARQRESVDQELAEAEPALQAAQEAVRQIDRKSLDPLKRLANPPAPVRLTLEAVVTMLGTPTRDWAGIRRVVTGRGFIGTVVEFSPEDLTSEARASVKSMLDKNKADLSYERVLGAYNACGPLFKWLTSQLNYGAIRERVAPLREAAASLEEEALGLRQESEVVEARLAELEERIAGLKVEYQVLTQEAAGLKAEMKLVEARVERSNGLLGGLRSETDRWQASADGFEDAMALVPGDSIFLAAFLAYAGRFDFQERRRLASDWESVLDCAGLRFSGQLEPATALLGPKAREEVVTQGLPEDELSMVNAAIVRRCDRYPLVVDPSGDASAWLERSLTAESDGRAPASTTFEDAGFAKALESALRFGTPLLVKGTSPGSFDPLLNPVLNREVARRGGRAVVPLGSRSVDFSPSFRILFLCPLPDPAFAPDTSSRVTLVSFGVTPASLRARCLEEVLTAECPEVCEARAAALRARGAARARVRELEDQLLTQLSESSGAALLDNDDLVKQLDTLRSQAAEAREAAASAGEALKTAEVTAARYARLSVGAARLFLALEGLARLHPLYQFPLDGFVALLRRELRGGKATRGSAGSSERVLALLDRVARAVVLRYQSSLFERHRQPLALRISQIVAASNGVRVLTPEELRSTSELFGADVDATGAAVEAAGAADGGLDWSESGAIAQLSVPTELDLLLRGAIADPPAALVRRAASALGTAAGPEQARLLAAALALGEGAAGDEEEEEARGGEAAAHRARRSEGWSGVGGRLLEEEAGTLRAIAAADAGVATEGGEAASSATELLRVAGDAGPDAGPVAAATPGMATAVSEALRRQLLLLAAAPSQAVGGAWSLVEAVLPGLRSQADASSAGVEAAATDPDAAPASPVVLAGPPGFDAASGVASVARRLGRKCMEVAMGGASGEQQATTALSSCLRRGGWVVLRNCHLATAEWLDGLKRRLQAADRVHQDFRLFLATQVLTPEAAVAAGVVGGAPASAAADVLAASRRAARGGLPNGLLRMARQTLVMQPAPGLRAGICQALQWTEGGEVAEPPAQRSRVLFVLSILHAVVKERARHAPLGFTASYDFGQPDAATGRRVVGELLTKACGGRKQLASAAVPWASIQGALGRCVYGGKVSAAEDEAVLTVLIRQLLVPEALAAGRSLLPWAAGDEEGDEGAAASERSLLGPDAAVSGVEELAQHVRSSLGPEAPPTLVGLPRSAEARRLRTAGRTLLADWLALQVAGDAAAADEQSDGAAAAASSSAATGQLTSLCATWLRRLPDDVTGVERLEAAAQLRRRQRSQAGASQSEDRSMAPLMRWALSEARASAAALKRLRRAIGDAKRLGDGKAPRLADTRAHVGLLRANTVPRTWIESCAPALVAGPSGAAASAAAAAAAAATRSVPAFVEYVRGQCVQASGLAEAAAGGEEALRSLLEGRGIWLGGLQRPGYALTACAQVAATLEQAPLHDIRLSCSVRPGWEQDGAVAAEATPGGPVRLCLLGVEAEGGAWEGGQLRPSEALRSALPPVQLSWSGGRDEAADGGTAQELQLRLYTDGSRATTLASVALPAAGMEESRQRDLWVLRAAALFALGDGVPAALGDNEEEAA